MKFIFEILFFIFKLLQWIVFRFIIILSQDLFIQYSPDCIYIKVVTFKKSNYSVLLEARLHFSEFQTCQMSRPQVYTTAKPMV